MKRDKSIDNDYKEIVEKLIDLLDKTDNSNEFIKLVSRQIRICVVEIERLENNKPFWLQKKKLEEYNYRINELEDKIIKYYIEIEREFMKK